MNIAQILQALSTLPENRPLPRLALEEAIRQKEEITPYLLDSLDAAYESVQNDGEYPGDLYWYGMFLLAQLREQRAFPKLLRFLRLDTSQLDNLLGDTLTEEFSSILCATFDGDTGPLEEILRCERLDPFARNCALCVLLYLNLRGDYPADRLDQLIETLLSSVEDPLFASLLANTAADRKLLFLAPTVRELAGQDRLENQIYSYDEFLDDLFSLDQQLRDIPSPLENAADALGTWACFSDSSRRRRISPRISDKLGPNDPCPCGSGKKYKKCCMLRENAPDPRMKNYPAPEAEAGGKTFKALFSAGDIETDQLVYKALHRNFCLPEGGALRERLELLTQAYRRFEETCRAEGLESCKAYDEKHMIHYFSEDWLCRLLETLDKLDERAVLPPRDQRLLEELTDTLNRMAEGD